MVGFCRMVRDLFALLILNLNILITIRFFLSLKRSVITFSSQFQFSCIFCFVKCLRLVLILNIVRSYQKLSNDIVDNWKLPRK